MSAREGTDKNFLGMIKRLLRDLEGENAETTLEEFFQQDPKQTIEALQYIIEGQDLTLIHWALLVLFQIDHHAGLYAARSLLKHTDPSLRWYVCEMLSEYGNKSIVPDIVERLLYDPDPDIRCSAVHALEQLADESVIPVLLKVRENDTGQSQLGHRVNQLAERAIKEISKE